MLQQSEILTGALVGFTASMLTDTRWRFITMSEALAAAEASQALDDPADVATQTDGQE